MFVKLCTLALLGRNEQLPHDKGMIFFLFLKAFLQKIHRIVTKLLIYQNFDASWVFQIAIRPFVGF